MAENERTYCVATYYEGQDEPNLECVLVPNHDGLHFDCKRSIQWRGTNEPASAPIITSTITPSPMGPIPTTTVGPCRQRRCVLPSSHGGDHMNYNGQLFADARTPSADQPLQPAMWAWRCPTHGIGTGGFDSRMHALQHAARMGCMLLCGVHVYEIPPAAADQPVQETILQVAILGNDGVTIHTQPRPARHGVVMQALWAMGHGKIGPDAQGFITTSGRFVGRAEAFVIAKRAGQILPPVPQDDDKQWLMTEDVW